MNCPHHHLIYRARMRSYRDLPLRLAEYGTIFRYEQSGELSGLIRVRCMTLNDAHIYVRYENIKAEIRNILQIYQEFYSTFGLSGYRYRLSFRGPTKADKYRGDPEKWQLAEDILKDVVEDLGLDYFIGVDEAAFYGPKIDIQFRNLMGREETVSTVQVDFLGAENFDLTYVDESGKPARPCILHRAPLSTHERFVSFLIEYYGGAFPTWCSPVQAVLLPVTESAATFAEGLRLELRSEGIRCDVDSSGDSFGKKIRRHTTRKVPNIMIIGEKELSEGTITWRRYGREEQETVTISAFKTELRREIKERVLGREPVMKIL